MLANIGLPLIHLHVGFALLWMLPIVALESAVYRKLLRASVRQCVWAGFLANLMTTAVGVPLAWFVAVLIGESLGYGFSSSSPLLLGIRYAAWLPPMEGTYVDWYRFYPVAVTTLLLPAFLLSVLLEWFVVRKLLRPERARGIRAVWKANGLSYACMLVFCLGWAATTQVAEPELHPRDALVLENHVSDVIWPACSDAPRRTRLVYLSNEADFGPPVFCLDLYGTRTGAERDCLTEAIEAWLREREIGPIGLRFLSAVYMEELSEGTYRSRADLQNELWLDGRDPADQRP